MTELEYVWVVKGSFNLNTEPFILGIFSSLGLAQEFRKSERISKYPYTDIEQYILDEKHD